MKLIPVYRGARLALWSQVDDQDYDTLIEHLWKLGKHGYAYTSVNTSLLMHRMILGLEKGDERQADHMNGDRVDNRRENLRIVTVPEQAQNRWCAPGTSRFRGVCWSKRQGQWVAQATIAGVNHHLGYFDDEHAAAKVAADFRAAHMPFSNPKREAVI